MESLSHEAPTPEEMPEVYREEVERLRAKYGTLAKAREVQESRTGWVSGDRHPHGFIAEFSDGYRKEFENSGEALEWVKETDGLIYTDKTRQEVAYGISIADLIERYGLDESLSRWSPPIVEK